MPERWIFHVSKRRRNRNFVFGVLLKVQLVPSHVEEIDVHQIKGLQNALLTLEVKRRKVSWIELKLLGISAVDESRMNFDILAIIHHRMPIFTIKVKLGVIRNFNEAFSVK